MEPYLQEKRAELMWALGQQGYTNAQLAKIFGFKSRSHVGEIMKKMPVGWKSPWRKG